MLKIEEQVAETGAWRVHKPYVYIHYVRGKDKDEIKANLSILKTKVEEEANKDFPAFLKKITDAKKAKVDKSSGDWKCIFKDGKYWRVYNPKTRQKENKKFKCPLTASMDIKSRLYEGGDLPKYGDVLWNVANPSKHKLWLENRTIVPSDVVRVKGPAAENSTKDCFGICYDVETGVDVETIMFVDFKDTSKTRRVRWGWNHLENTLTVPYQYPEVQFNLGGIKKVGFLIGFGDNLVLPENVLETVSADTTVLIEYFDTASPYGEEFDQPEVAVTEVKLGTFTITPEAERYYTPTMMLKLHTECECPEHDSWI